MNLKGRHILVLGLGESGFAMVRWCLRLGARVSVVDSRPAPVNRDPALALGARVICGADAFADLKLLDGVDLVALSPGLAKSDPLPQAALAKGLPLWSEIEFFADALRQLSPDARVLAITGSNGKTTTTALTAALVNAAGVSAVAAGNISPAALDALIDALDHQALPAVWVLELSSFQLETTHTLNAASATVLNVSEDHLDRYRDLDDYAAAKARVFVGATAAVLNREDVRVLAMGADLGSTRRVSFGLDPAPSAADFGLVDGWLMHGQTRLIEARTLGLTGSHNVANALAALALCEAVGIAPARVLAALRDFKGLPHRVEWVAAENGVDYYDDSKGTNVGATLAALQGMGRQVAIILGGDGKGQDFSPLKAALSEHGRAVALIGRDADAVAAAIAGCGVSSRRCADMSEAVAYCRAQAKAGDAVLLSPACASLDMYRNYAHRAEVFIAAVKAQTGGTAC